VVEEEQESRVPRPVVTDCIGIRGLIGMIGQYEGLDASRTETHRSRLLAVSEDRLGESGTAEESIAIAGDRYLRSPLSVDTVVTKRLRRRARQVRRIWRWQAESGLHDGLGEVPMD
jgi:hypothetical protein